MTYATLTEVQELMAQFTLSATSKPSTTQATAIMDDISYEIDTHLAAQGVVVPVTEPAYFLGWLGRVNAYGATAAILKSMFPASTGPGETPAWAFWEARYRAALKAIDDGELPPGVASTSRISPSTYFTRYPDEEQVAGLISEPFFRRAKEY